MEAQFESHTVGTKLAPSYLLTPRLAYHEITTVKTAYRYSVTTERFQEHVSALQRFRGRVRQQSEITFDDGHVSQIDNAVPILNSFGQTAVFFVTVSWTGKRRGYMNWNHLRELHACGHEVQSHGWSHTFLTDCSEPELRSQLERSKNELEDRLGTKVDAISMPGGRWNSRVLEACAAAGYKRVFTSDPWSEKSPTAGISMTGRWMITRKTTAPNVLILLEGTGTMVRVLRIRHRFQELAKFMLGDRIYGGLWRTLSSKRRSFEEIGESQMPSQESEPR